MANRIMLNETSYFGKGAIQEIAGEVKSRGCRKVMVCTDPDLLKFQVATKVTDVLERAGDFLCRVRWNQGQPHHRKRSGGCGLLQEGSR